MWPGDHVGRHLNRLFVDELVCQRHQPTHVRLYLRHRSNLKSNTQVMHHQCLSYWSTNNKKKATCWHHGSTGSCCVPCGAPRSNSIITNTIPCITYLLRRLSPKLKTNFYDTIIWMYKPTGHIAIQVWDALLMPQPSQCKSGRATVKKQLISINKLWLNRRLLAKFFEFHWHLPWTSESTGHNTAWYTYTRPPVKALTLSTSHRSCAAARVQPQGNNIIITIKMLGWLSRKMQWNKLSSSPLSSWTDSVGQASCNTPHLKVTAWLIKFLGSNHPHTDEKNNDATSQCQLLALQWREAAPNTPFLHTTSAKIAFDLLQIFRPWNEQSKETALAKHIYIYYMWYYIISLLMLAWQGA